MNEAGPIKHDPKVCGLDPATDCATCKPKTIAFRKREAQLSRLAILQARLEKANIDVKDLSDIVWMMIEPQIEERIQRLTKLHLDAELRNKVLVSKVQ